MVEKEKGYLRISRKGDGMTSHHTLLLVKGATHAHGRKRGKLLQKGGGGKDRKNMGPFQKSPTTKEPLSLKKGKRLIITSKGRIGVFMPKDFQPPSFQIRKKKSSFLTRERTNFRTSSR